MKVKVLLVSLLISIGLYAGEIRVAVAANVSYAVNDLIKAFNTLYPDTKVQVQLGSSGKLTAQIKNGAPYDLFMSANMKYPQALYQEGIAVTRPLVYAQGSLAFFSSKPRAFDKGMALLEEDAIRRIAIANPKTAPYGKAAVEVLKNAGIYEKIKSKFIYGESISQTVTYATTAADLGLIAKSSLFSPHMAQYKEGTNWKSVDSKLYTPISQGIVLLKKSAANAEAAAFYAFIFSRKAEEIFKKFGYLIP
jgi:molybdate transport system substrate-binding protein